MNKRIRRKVHKKCMFDVIYDISISHLWRKKLFESKEGEKFQVDRLSSFPEPGLKRLHRILCRYNLKYYVSKVPDQEGPKWDWTEKGFVYFKFQSVEFPEIFDFSSNNPDSF